MTFHNTPFYNSNFQFFNFAALTPAIPAADRQSFYGSFTRDLCDKYLTVFADFKYTRSFFNAGLAPTPFSPDPFHDAQGIGFSPIGISVPLTNPFNPFTVADTTLPAGTANAGLPVTTGVTYRSLEAGPRTAPTTKHDMLFDAGIKGEMGEFGDYFKTWNWETGFPLFPGRGDKSLGRRCQRARLAGSAPGYGPGYGVQSLLKLPRGEPTDRRRARQSLCYFA